jgi:hypothetical protein
MHNAPFKVQSKIYVYAILKQRIDGLFDELFGLLRALLEKYCKYPKRLVPEYNLYTLQVHI